MPPLPVSKRHSSPNVVISKPLPPAHGSAAAYTSPGSATDLPRFADLNLNANLGHELSQHDESQLLLPPTDFGGVSVDPHAAERIVNSMAASELPSTRSHFPLTSDPAFAPTAPAFLAPLLAVHAAAVPSTLLAALPDRVRAVLDPTAAAARACMGAGVPGLLAATVVLLGVCVAACLWERRHGRTNWRSWHRNGPRSAAAPREMERVVVMMPGDEKSRLPSVGEEDDEDDIADERRGSSSPCPLYVRKGRAARAVADLVVMRSGSWHGLAGDAEQGNVCAQCLQASPTGRWLRRRASGGRMDCTGHSCSHGPVPEAVAEADSMMERSPTPLP